MKTIGTADFIKSYGQVIEAVMGGETVLIERYGRPGTVLMSYAAYKKMKEQVGEKV